jgi:predicted nucleic acid-binding protein
MRIAVKDANVLIDMAVAGLLESWFQLGISTCTTDIVLQQVKRDPQAAAVLPFVASGMLEIVSLTGEQLSLCVQHYGHLRIGIADSSVILLAKERKALLLTGDRRVTREGRVAGIEVRGLLWIFDELVARTILPPKLAAIKLRAVLDAGAFLPEDECERRLEAWRSVP